MTDLLSLIGSAGNHLEDRIMRKCRSALCLVVSCSFLIADAKASAAETSAAMIKRIESAVVHVETNNSSGSGFIVDIDKRLVATNYHVIEGAKELWITLSNGTRIDVTGFSALAPDHDLAIVQVREGTPLHTKLELAQSIPDKATIVFALGSPKGLSGSVSDGVVSAVRQGIEIKDSFVKDTGVDVYGTLGLSVLTKWIQSSAPISPGNSGGPLVTSDGKVVGVNSWCRTDGQNLNFAVSASHLVPLVSKSVDAQPLENLPKPRSRVAMFAPSRGTRTMELWKAYGQINRLYNEKAQRARPRSVAPSNVITYWRNLSRFYSEQAAAFRKLDIHGADLELSILCSLDADNMEKLSAIYATAAQVLKASPEPPIPDTLLIAALGPGYYATLPSDEFTQRAFAALAEKGRDVSATNEKMIQVFTLLRAEFSTRYECEFPDVWTIEAVGSPNR